MMSEFDLMMKCDMCYDRTSTGRKPMCATEVLEMDSNRDKLTDRSA
jgi:Fe-S-cluster-containing dehydrogenase component